MHIASSVLVGEQDGKTPIWRHRITLKRILSRETSGLNLEHGPQAGCWDSSGCVDGTEFHEQATVWCKELGRAGHCKHISKLNSMTTFRVGITSTAPWRLQKEAKPVRYRQFKWLNPRFNPVTQLINTAELSRCVRQIQVGSQHLGLGHTTLWLWLKIMWYVNENKTDTWLPATSKKSTENYVNWLQGSIWSETDFTLRPHSLVQQGRAYHFARHILAAP